VTLRPAEEMSRLSHRVQQFLRYAIPRPWGWHSVPRLRGSEFGRQILVEDEVLEAHLSSAQIGLFRSMPVLEQEHALETLHFLEQQGHWDRVLAQVALLHDVGKTSSPVRLWHRVVRVLLQAIHPALLPSLAKDDPGSWRYPFYVLLHHARLGADQAARAGADPWAVALIYWHHTAPELSGLDSEGRVLLAALQSADELA
jgi:hypothetical protein